MLILHMTIPFFVDQNIYIYIYYALSFLIPFLIFFSLYPSVEDLRDAMPRFVFGFFLVLFLYSRF